MKNIHVLPTDKPSEFYSIDGKHKLANSTMAMDWYISSVGYKPHNIYITSDEEIKEGDWCLCSEELIHKVVEIKSNIGIIRFQDGNTEVLDACKKIILTTDELYIHNDLIPKEYNLFPQYIQKIDDEFLEWFVKNPSCEVVEVQRGYLGMGGFVQTNEPISKDKVEYKIIIPKEEIKLEDVFNDNKRENIKKFIHEVKSIPAEEILDNRSNAYEFLDFDKKDMNTCKNFDRETGCDLVDCPCEKEQILSKAKQEFERGITITHINKQETLEEVAEKYSNKYYSQEVYERDIEEAVIFGAKWQQENSYSEEEVLNFTQTMIMQYKFGNTNIEQMDLLKETLQLFKNK